MKDVKDWQESLKQHQSMRHKNSLVFLLSTSAYIIYYAVLAYDYHNYHKTAILETFALHVK